MDNSKKKTIIIVAGILLVVILTTAILLITRKDKPSNNSGNIIGQEIRLSYWGLWEPPEVMEPIIKEFEDQNPNVKIDYSMSTFTEYESRLYTRLEQGATASEPAPDIFRIHNTWVPKYYKYLAPLPESIMTSDEYSEIFYPTAKEDFTGKDGKIYAIPWEIDGLVVYYNKQLLSEVGVSKPPEDWDSFFELARELTIKDSAGRITQSGLAIGTSRNINHSAEILSFLLLQEGVDIIDQTRTRVTLNTPKAQRVFQTYTDFARGDTAIWSPALKKDLEMFFSGDLAMMIAPSWRTFDIIDAAPRIEFDTAPLPQLKANPQKIYLSTYWGDTVSKTAKNTEIAWKFVKFISEKEQQLKLYANSSSIRAFGEPYSLVELNKEMLGKPYVSAIAEMAPYMRSWQMGDEIFIKDTLDLAITEIIENRRDISSALKDAEDSINDRISVTNN